MLLIVGSLLVPVLPSDCNQAVTRGSSVLVAFDASDSENEMGAIACSSGVGGGSHVYSAINIRPLAENYWEGHADGISDAVMSPHYDAVLERMDSTTPMADHRIPNTSVARFRNEPDLAPAIPPRRAV